MESGNQFQARFSLVAVVYEFTRWGTGEYSLCREVPEPCLVLFFFLQQEALEPFPQLAHE